ncbi:hypothetical protein BJ165DRAFT_1516748 [Panaeolus papilionaceus]|nr:hypothetical protein BJ165DRAFT_1516748 [Panaeolus papilionaceus]
MVSAIMYGPTSSSTCGSVITVILAQSTRAVLGAISKININFNKIQRSGFPGEQSPIITALSPTSNLPSLGSCLETSNWV